MTTEWLRFFLAIFATYRLAQFLPYDDGPLFIFQRIRDFADSKAKAQQESGNELGFWVNVNAGVHCPMCMGLYAAALCTALFIWPSGWGDMALLILALAGGQHLLQQVMK